MQDTAKDRFLARIEEGRAGWQALVAEVGEGRMEEPGPMGDWTFKDLAAHLTGWRERTIGRLEAAGRGAPEPPPPWPAELTDDDPINDWIYQQNRDRPLAEVLADADRSFARLAAAVAALPEEALATPGYFPWTEGQALGDVDPSGHLREEHEPDVRAWLAGTRSS
jgi:hypothetical protein